MRRGWIRGSMPRTRTRTLPPTPSLRPHPAFALTLAAPRPELSPPALTSSTLAPTSSSPTTHPTSLPLRYVDDLFRRREAAAQQATQEAQEATWREAEARQRRKVEAERRWQLEVRARRARDRSARLAAGATPEVKAGRLLLREAAAEAELHRAMSPADGARRPPSALGVASRHVTTAYAAARPRTSSPRTSSHQIAPEPGPAPWSFAGPEYQSGILGSRPMLGNEGFNRGLRARPAE